MKSKFSDDVFVMWQVQVRRSRAQGWKNKGWFETRSAARAKAACMRDEWRTGWDFAGIVHQGYGFGNTRVVRVVVVMPCSSSPPMMPSPRAPGSYADTRTIHARAVQWRAK